MSDALDARRRQLQAWRARADADPARHAHQCLALRREAALCRAAPTMQAYLQASDAGFETTRAAWLDQQAMQLRLARALGQPGMAQAAWSACQRALAARGQSDWVAAVQQGASALALAQARQAQAEGGFLRCLLNLLLWHGGEPWQGQPWADAVEGWGLACQAEPGLALAVAQGRLATHPLAQRLPWQGAALDLVQSWLQGLPPPPRVVPPPLPDPLALQQAAQQAWAAALELPGTAQAAGDPGIAARDCPGDDASCDPVALALRRQLQGLLADEAAWPEPLLQAHAADTGARLQACRNPLQRLQLSAWAAACLALECDWQQVLVTACSLPIRAACAVVVLGDGLRPGLDKALRVSHALTGCGPRALLGQRELQRRLRQHLAPRLEGVLGERSIGLGEAGADLLPPLSAWLAVQVARKGCDAATLCRDLPAALAVTLDELEVAEPVVRPLSLRLWGQSLPFDDWPSLVARPPRPEVPGLPLPRPAEGPA